MDAKELRDRSTEDLVELGKTLRKQLFTYRMRSATAQLEDSSLIKKTRRDIARIETIVTERTATTVAGNAQP